jgi:hypothetical protein
MLYSSLRVESSLFPMRLADLPTKKRSSLSLSLDFSSRWSPCRRHDPACTSDTRCASKTCPEMARYPTTNDTFAVVLAKHSVRATTCAQPSELVCRLAWRSSHELSTFQGIRGIQALKIKDGRGMEDRWDLEFRSLAAGTPLRANVAFDPSQTFSWTSKKKESSYGTRLCVVESKEEKQQRGTKHKRGESAANEMGLDPSRMFPFVPIRPHSSPFVLFPKAGRDKGKSMSLISCLLLSLSDLGCSLYLCNGTGRTTHLWFLVSSDLHLLLSSFLGPQSSPGAGPGSVASCHIKQAAVRHCLSGTSSERGRCLLEQAATPIARRTRWQKDCQGTSGLIRA